MKKALANTARWL